VGITNQGLEDMVSGAVGALATPYTNANAYIGVGNGTAAFAKTQTDLQGASKKRNAMDATFPTVSGTPAATITAKATFATGDANFAWEEVSLFNASTAGRMFSRLVQAFGTKTSAAVWVMTLTVTPTLP
jgi:hypothetical protein